MSFGERLERSRVSKGVSQADIARAAGIKDSSISEWFGDKVNPSNIKAWPLLRAAAFLDVSASWLLFGLGNEDPISPTVLLAAEPVHPYHVWPFDHIQPERYFALPDHARRAIASYVDGVILGFASKP